MKETTLDQFSKKPQSYIQAAQRERVLVTKNGRPVALVVGLEHKDAEDWQIEMSSDFWQMIEERRSRPTLSLDKVESFLLEET